MLNIDWTPLTFLPRPKPRTETKTTKKCSQGASRPRPRYQAQTWNCLPHDITLAESLTAFETQLKHHLFEQSYPDVLFC